MAADTPDPSPRDEPAASAKPAATGVRTILIAEDHADSRAAFQALLESVGYRVVVACTGREAVEIGLQQPPDVVLMDLMMPELDGMEATRQLRASTLYDDVPIIAVSALTSARAQTLEAGCDDFIPKPVDIRLLLRRVEEWATSGRSGSG